MDKESKLFDILTEKYGTVHKYGWTSTNEFCVWIEFKWIHAFLKEIKEVVGDYFDEERICVIQGDCIVIDLFEVAKANNIDIDSIVDSEKFIQKCPRPKSIK